MDQPYIGVIFAMANTFAPRDWALCDGRSLSISENETLYTLIGTTYGGDGVQSFNLPDLRGRVPIGQGNAPGLGSYVIGQMAGQEQVTMLSVNMPSHTHPLSVNNLQGNTAVPTSATNIAGTYTGSGSSAQPVAFYGPATNVQMAPSISVAGSSLPINIMQPVLTINYVISLYGIFPSRN